MLERQARLTDERPYCKQAVTPVCARARARLVQLKRCGPVPGDDEECGLRSDCDRKDDGVGVASVYVDCLGQAEECGVCWGLGAARHDEGRSVGTCVHGVYVTHANVTALGEDKVGSVLYGDGTARVTAGSEGPSHAVAVSQGNEKMRMGERNSEARDNLAAAADWRHTRVQFNPKGGIAHVRGAAALLRNFAAENLSA